MIERDKAKPAIATVVAADGTETHRKGQESQHGSQSAVSTQSPNSVYVVETRNARTDGRWLPMTMSMTLDSAEYYIESYELNKMSGCEFRVVRYESILK